MRAHIGYVLARVRVRVVRDLEDVPVLHRLLL